MSATTVSAPVTFPAGTIVALEVSVENYVATYAETFHEWVHGAVIAMTPVPARHDLLTAYFRMLLEAYLALDLLGSVRSAPFVMRLDTLGAIREPDLQVILHGNPGTLSDTGMIGAADLCVEVVSDESIARDYGDKFKEYEKAGVREYWILDPLRHECRFFRLRPSGRYATIQPDDSGRYATPLLPKLALHVPTLWQDPLPDLFAIAESVRAMVQPGR